MVTVLPSDLPEFMSWTWADIEPRYRELEGQDLNSDTVAAWLRDWTHLADQVAELESRLYVATTQNTADEDVAQRYREVVQDVSPQVQAAEQRLQQKLLASGLQPEGFEIPLRNMRAEVELFREENLPLQAEEKLLVEQYYKIIGGQTVEWDGREIPITQLVPIGEEPDRDRRERAWRLGVGRALQDRGAINDIWKKALPLRIQMAENAGYSSYREFRWRQFLRFDYTPDDALRFDESVERVVVPVLARLRERRRQRMGLEQLRPWDLRVDPTGSAPLRPFADVDVLEERSSRIFHHVDPQLGAYFDVMWHEGLLDLGSRKNKGPGGYSTTFPDSGLPFIFMNAAGTRMDVETVLHEAGHAFHAFERASLPYGQQRTVPMEFAEVASMAMEFLSEPYLTQDQGGFYTEGEAARARLEHLEQRVLALWCTIASVDAFQQWVYRNPDVARDPDACDVEWCEVQARFSPGVDWSGLERERGVGWHSVLHIHAFPFYMIDYALAQLGAVQVWTNAQRDQAAAVAGYREALALGGTRSLPDLFAAAGARFAFDEGTLREAVATVERAIAELDPVDE